MIIILIFPSLLFIIEDIGDDFTLNLIDVTHWIRSCFSEFVQQKNDESIVFGRKNMRYAWILDILHTICAWNDQRSAVHTTWAQH